MKFMRLQLKKILVDAHISFIESHSLDESEAFHKSAEGEKKNLYVLTQKRSASEKSPGRMNQAMNSVMKVDIHIWK